MKNHIDTRVRIISGLLIAGAVLLVVRLYFLQIVHGDEYLEAATRQYVEQSSDTVKRNNVYFTTKDGALVAAAVMQRGWRIALTPETLVDAEDAYTKISAIIPIDKDRFFASAAKKDDPYEEIAFRVSDEDAKKVRALKIKGVLLVGDEWRAYPGDDLAAQVVGFVGYKGNKRMGVYGLERQYEHTLVDNSTGLYVNPFAEIFTNVGALITEDPASVEGDIITSIEPNVQAELEMILDEVTEEYSTKTVGGIVMDPRTGEIIAMGLRPSFNLNTFNTVKDASLYANPLVEGRYELGSIMKPLTVAAGIDSGAVSRNSTYYDTGCTTRSTKRFCNYDGKARGTVPMQEVLSQSLNLGVTYIADTMGHAVFTKYMQAFGFGSKTGIDLPNEVASNISILGDGEKPDINYASASFGQGISVSPIAMTRALSVLANGGMLTSPHLVSSVRYDTGLIREIRPTSSVPVLKPESASAVSSMLTEVYDTALLKGKFKMDRYAIAAKTGTAQIVGPGGSYYTDRYLHSFFGYFPAQDARFIVFLFAIEPQGAEYASATLAEPFSHMAKFLINYYELPPDR